MILPIYSSIAQVNITYLDAAEYLGAGPIRAFINVTLTLKFLRILAGVITFVPAISVTVVDDLYEVYKSEGSEVVGLISVMKSVLRHAFFFEKN